jgi:hypothetical protein
MDSNMLKMENLCKYQQYVGEATKCFVQIVWIFQCRPMVYRKGDVKPINNAFPSSIIWWWEKMRCVACKHDLKWQQESTSCQCYHDWDLSLVIHPKNFDMFLAFDFPSSFTYTWDKVDSCFITIITNEKGML